MYYRNKRKGIQETIHVVNICIAVCGVCSSDLHIGEDWHRGCKLKSGNCHQNSGRCRDGMGYGVFDECAGRHCTDWKKELDFSNIIRTCDRRVMAVLLSGATAWRSFEGRAD